MDYRNYEYYYREEPKVIAKPRPNRGRIAAIVCAILVLALAVGALGGFVGYNLAGNKVTVLHSQGGETTTKQLSATGTASVTGVVEAVADSVVEINCRVRVSSGMFYYNATGAGSGVIISEDGNIITNHHVIEGATAITVRLRDGEEFAASLVGSDSRHDIAIIKIDADGLTVATFGDSDMLKVGQTAIVIGNPLGTLGGTVTSGIISALDREITIDGVTMNLLQTDASINSGNSGGGMFDLDGRLIGIINAKSTGTNVEGLGFAIPASTALSVATEILKR